MTTVAKLVFWEILGVCRQNPALTGPEGCLAAGPARVCRKQHLTAPPSRTLSRSFKPVVFPQTGCSGSSWGGGSATASVSEGMLVARFTRFPSRASILSALLSFFAFPSACASLWRLPTCCAGHDCRKIYKTSSSCLYSFSFIVVLRFG